MMYGTEGLVEERLRNANLHYLLGTQTLIFILSLRLF
jgi:hypothetical protein